MYRLPERIHPELQKIITKNLLFVFDQVFDIQDGYPDEDFLKITFSDTALDPLADPLAGDTVIQENVKKLSEFIHGLYTELQDPDNEYTFSEIGEYALFHTLLNYSTIWEDMNQDNPASAPSAEYKELIQLVPGSNYNMVFQSPLSAEEKKFVWDFADKEVKSLQEELEGEGDVEEYLHQMKASIILRLICPQLLVTEITACEVPNFLFWDDDFALLDRYGMEGFQAIRQSSTGRMLGLTRNENHTITGSEKHKIDKGEK